MSYCNITATATHRAARAILTVAPIFQLPINPRRIYIIRIAADANIRWGSLSMVSQSVRAAAQWKTVNCQLTVLCRVDMRMKRARARQQQQGAFNVIIIIIILLYITLYIVWAVCTCVRDEWNARAQYIYRHTRRHLCNNQCAFHIYILFILFFPRSTFHRRV